MAKERLAFEVTKLVHGEQKAIEAQKQAKAAFGNGSAEDMPEISIDKATEFVSDVLVIANVAKSKGEAKRLIEGGGVAINENKITDAFAKIPQEVMAEGKFILHKGKKVHIRIVLK